MGRNIPYVGCLLEQEIIQKIGGNKSKEKIFTKDVVIENDLLIMSFYTYRNQVCLIDEELTDINFSEFSENDKKMIHKEIMSENFK